jgi:hypothetical protein
LLTTYPTKDLYLEYKKRTLKSQNLKNPTSYVWCFVLIIPATQESETTRLWFEIRLGKVSKMPSQQNKPGVMVACL